MLGLFYIKIFIDCELYSINIVKNFSMDRGLLNFSLVERLLVIYDWWGSDFLGV